MEVAVERGQRRRAFDPPHAVAQNRNVAAADGIEFVLDVADDSLQRVLDAHQSGGQAVFVDGDRDMKAAAAEILQHHIERLGAGLEKRLAHDFLEIEIFARRRRREQIFGQQNADDFFAIAVVDRIARMPVLCDRRHRLVAARGERDGNDLRIGNHDIAHFHIGDMQNALDHASRVFRQPPLRAHLDDLGDEIGAALPPDNLAPPSRKRAQARVLRFRFGFFHRFDHSANARKIRFSRAVIARASPSVSWRMPARCKTPCTTNRA